MAATEVQAQKNTSVSGATLSVGPFTYTAGNMLEVSVATDGLNTTPTCSDTTHSVTPTTVQIKSSTAALKETTAMFEFTNITGGSTTIQVGGLGVAGATVIVREWSGLTTSTPLDKSTGAVSNTSVTAQSTGTTAATTSAVELCVAIDSFNGSGTATPSALTNSYTLLTGANDHEYNAASFWPIASARFDQTSTGTQGTTFTWTSGPYAAIIATFIEVVAGGPSILLLNQIPNTLVRM